MGDTHEELVRRLRERAWERSNKLCRGVTDPALMIYPDNLVEHEAAATIEALVQERDKANNTVNCQSYARRRAEAAARTSSAARLRGSDR